MDDEFNWGMVTALLWVCVFWLAAVLVGTWVFS